MLFLNFAHQRARYVLSVCFLILYLIIGQTQAPTSLWAQENVAQGSEAPVVVLLFGDSLTAGYGLKQPDTWAALIDKRFRAEGLPVRVINAGVSGDTTAQGLARLGWALGDDPDIVFLELGANDALRGMSPERAEANLDAMLAQISKQGARILLSGMLAPPNMGPEYAKRFDPIYPRLAEKYDVLLDPFILEGVAGDMSLNLPDGLHPNAKGAAKIAERLYPLVRSLVVKELEERKETALAQ